MTSSAAVRIARPFEASAEETFYAWLDPLVMHRWLFVRPQTEIVEITMSPRAGGFFSIIEKDRTRHIDHRGRFEEMVKPCHLALSIEGDTPVSIDIAPRGTGCELVMQLDRDAVDSWSAMLVRLDSVLRGEC